MYTYPYKIQETYYKQARYFIAKEFSPQECITKGVLCHCKESKICLLREMTIK